MSDHDQALAEREETRAQAAEDLRNNHQRLMTLHYRMAVVRPANRAADIVDSGPWCPAGTRRRISMARDFAAWVMEHHAEPERVIAALFSGDPYVIEADLMRYADARAKADADALEVDA